MRANPGGQLSPTEVSGRDELIRRLWRILEQRGVVLSAERRMGKTSMVKKMVAEAPPDVLPLYHDLEGVRTPLDFVEIVFHDVAAYLGRLQKITMKSRQWLAGLEIKDFVKFPDTLAPQWKTLLTKTIEDLVEHQDRTVIFFWDEMPLMLYNIKQRSGEEAAMEVLDTLRSLRQMHPGLRMVFTGSIGLHNVITGLKRSGYANDPTNDMATVDVPPLAPDHARELARLLLDGENIAAQDREDVARAVAAAVDGIPYFIHHVVEQMALREGPMDAATAEEIVAACLTDPQDCWHLRYYRERINTYYSVAEQGFALNLLDILAVAGGPLPFPELFNRLKSQLPTEDSELARDVLGLLLRDHYIVQETAGEYRFRFSLIQRCWRLQRGVAP